MDRYQVANSPNGPWMEMVVANSPARALDNAQAMFDWSVVWVAKMKPIRGEDILPPQEVFFGELEERISILYGSAMADSLHGVLTGRAYHLIEMALSGHLLDEEVDLLVPDIKHPYGRDQAVRPNDFKSPGPDDGPQRKPSLKELLG